MPSAPRPGWECLETTDRKLDFLIGAVTSAIAVWPNLAGLPPTPTLILVVTMLAGIVGLNFVCGWLIFRWTVRQAASRES